MKAIQTTKYQTADGTTFNSLEKAQAYEIESVAKAVVGEDRKLTVPALLEAMATKPQAFIDVLAQMTGDEEQIAAE